MKKAEEKWYFRNPNLGKNDPEDSLNNYDRIEYID